MKTIFLNLTVATISLIAIPLAASGQEDRYTSAMKSAIELMDQAASPAEFTECANRFERIIIHTVGFGAEGEAPSCLIGERVHLLFNNICCFTDAPDKYICVLNDRCAYFLKAVCRKDLFCRVLDFLPNVDIGWVDILCTLEGAIFHSS